MCEGVKVGVMVGGKCVKGRGGDASGQALEYGSDLHVNERQKIRHYRSRSTEE